MSCPFNEGLSSWLESFRPHLTIAKESVEKWREKWGGRSLDRAAPFDRKWVDSLELGGRMGLTQSKLSSSPNGLSLPPSNWLDFFCYAGQRAEARTEGICPSSVTAENLRFFIPPPTSKQVKERVDVWRWKGGGEGGPRRIVAVFSPCLAFPDHQVPTGVRCV